MDYLLNELSKYQEVNPNTALRDKCSADDIFKYFSHFSEKKICHFMQIVLNGENLHEMSNPVFWEK